MKAKHVLIVDDEADIRELIVLTLMRMGVESVTASTCQEAFVRLAEQSFDLCLTDMRLPDGDGLSVLTHIAGSYGNTPVAVITAYGSTDNAVAALKAGAFDYLSKPIQLKQLREVITSALNLPKAANERPRRGSAVDRAGETTPPGLSDSGAHRALGASRLLGESAPMQKAREMIAKLARSQAPVHIAGESGSGK